MVQPEPVIVIQPIVVVIVWVLLVMVVVVVAGATIGVGDGAQAVWLAMAAIRRGVCEIYKSSVKRHCYYFFCCIDHKNY